MATIDTDVVVLLISYIGKAELNDIEIHAYLINSDRYYNIRQIIRELGSDIFLALPFFYAFTVCDTVFMVRVSVKHMMFGWKERWIHRYFCRAWRKAYQRNIQSHWPTWEFCVAAIQVETWHTRCCSTWQIQEV